MQCKVTSASFKAQANFDSAIQGAADSIGRLTRKQSWLVHGAIMIWSFAPNADPVSLTGFVVHIARQPIMREIWPSE